MIVRSIFILNAFFFLLVACGAGKKIYKLPNQISASHTLKNKILLKPISKVVDKVKNEALIDIVIVRIDSVDSNSYNICIKPSNFETEKAFCDLDNPCEKPKGYGMIDDTPILIYGSLDPFFTKISDPVDFLKADKNEKSLTSLHEPYSCYSYFKDKVYGDEVESIEYKGKFDSLDW